MSQAPILVLGARGKTGRRVVARLRDLDVPVRAASRSAETGTLFDYGDPATWGPALDGVRAVYLVPMIEFVDLAVVSAFVRQAAAAGVQRIVLLSARGEEHPQQEPLVTLVRDSVPEWTILRAGWFAQNFSEDFLLEPVMAGDLALPAGEGREAFIDAEDIADVAVAALTSDGHAGREYELTGPEALSFRTVASLISEASGREVRYTPVDRETYAAALSRQGFPDGVVQEVADLMEAIARGAGETVADGVHRALGRQPRSFTDFVKGAAAAGAWKS